MRYRPSFEAFAELARSHNVVPVYRLFPNTIMVFQSDHLETWRMLPGETPDRSVIEFALYAPCRRYVVQPRPRFVLI